MPNLVTFAVRCTLFVFCVLSHALVAPHAALAQVTPLSTWVDGKFPLTISSPTLTNGGGRIDCAPRTPGCKPLNLARCTDPTPMPIRFIVGPGAAGLPAYTGTSQVLYAFLGTINTCVYSTIAGQTGYNPNLLIGTSTSLAGSAPFFANGSQSFVFPDGIAMFNEMLPQVTQSKVYTVADMLQAIGVCGENGVQMSTYYLCMGVDATGSRGINNNASTSQTATNTAGAQNSGQSPVTFLQFQVDTIPPPAPSIASLKSLNGRCEINVEYQNVALDLFSVSVKYSKNPGNLAVPCNLWTEDVITSPSKNAVGQQSGTIPFIIDGLENDSTYAFCAEAEDYMQNTSAPSNNALGNPRFECDLFACYPDTLKTGYCGQMAGGQLWLGSAAVLALRLSTRLMQRGRKRMGR